MPDLNIAIYSHNTNITAMQTAIIRAWKPQHVVTFDNFNELVGALRHYTYDIMFVNDYGTVDPEQTAALLRDQVNVRDPTMLSVLVSGKTTRRSVRAAVRMGYDDVLTIPFSASQLIGKLTSLAHAERRFVRAPGYFGPDRRRFDEGPPPGVVERRNIDAENVRTVEPRLKSG